MDGPNLSPTKQEKKSFNGLKLQFNVPNIRNISASISYFIHTMLPTC